MSAFPDVAWACVTLLRSCAWCLIETLFWFNSKGTVHTYYVTKQCLKYEKIWRQNMPLKQKVMFISQTSLQTSEACACVTGCATTVRHIRSVKTFLVHIQIGFIHCIYIVSTYVHARSWMLACASCTSCSSAGARYYDFNLSQNYHFSILIGVMREFSSFLSSFFKFFENLIIFPLSWQSNVSRKRVSEIVNSKSAREKNIILLDSQSCWHQG